MELIGKITKDIKERIETESFDIDGDWEFKGSVTRNGADILDRANHSGTQDIETIDGLVNALADLVNALANKVSTEVGKGLSSEDFTSQEKSKLSGLESSKFKGKFTTVGSLPNTGSAGDYADVDVVGEDVQRYIWDSTDDKWVQQSGIVSELTGSEIKTLYEYQPDTNAFTDTDVDKLANTADKTLPINWLEVSTSTFLIEPEHAGMSLWVTADCVITVSAHSTLPTGFNCEILKADTVLIVSVVATGGDTIRDGKSVIVSDASVFKSPSAGVIGLVGDVS